MKLFNPMTKEQAKEFYEVIEKELAHAPDYRCKQFLINCLNDIKFFTENFTKDY